MQERLSNDEFFGRLAELLGATKEHGSVSITQKRLTYDPSNPPPQKQTKPTASKKKKPAFTKNVLPATSPTDLSDIASLLDSSIYSASRSSPTSTAITTPEPEPADLGGQGEKFQVLVRATNCKSNDKRNAGKKVKLSTVVDGDAAALEGFFARLAETSKAGLTALKKRDKKKKKKKEKQKAKKQKKTAAVS